MTSLALLSLVEDYWGNLIKDIKDAGKLLKTTFENNKVLFKNK